MARPFETDTRYFQLVVLLAKPVEMKDEELSVYKQRVPFENDLRISRSA